MQAFEAHVGKIIGELVRADIEVLYAAGREVFRVPIHDGQRETDGFRILKINRASGLLIAKLRELLQNGAHMAGRFHAGNDFNSKLPRVINQPVHLCLGQIPAAVIGMMVIIGVSVSKRRGQVIGMTGGCDNC